MGARERKQTSLVMLLASKEMDILMSEVSSSTVLGEVVNIEVCIKLVIMGGDQHFPRSLS